MTVKISIKFILRTKRFKFSKTEILSRLIKKNKESIITDTTKKYFSTLSQEFRELTKKEPSLMFLYLIKENQKEKRINTNNKHKKN